MIQVREMLNEMKYPYKINVSVPNAIEGEGDVTQFFLRDPDGYYVEICNCGILTRFWHGDEKVNTDYFVVNRILRFDLGAGLDWCLLF